MKTIILAILSVLAALQLRAQGYVDFNNALGGMVYTNNGVNTGLAGSGYLAQLYVGAASEIEANLIPDPITVPFIGNGAEGIFGDGTVLINTFVTAGNSGTFQVRAFPDTFSSYAQAYAAALGNPLILVGKSALFQNTTGTSGSPAASLDMMPSFTRVVVPEPSAVFLCGLGAAAFWWQRRRRA